MENIVTLVGGLLGLVFILLIVSINMHLRKIRTYQYMQLKMLNKLLEKESKEFDLINLYSEGNKNG